MPHLMKIYLIMVPLYHTYQYINYIYFIVIYIILYFIKLLLATVGFSTLDTTTDVLYYRIFITYLLPTLGYFALLNHLSEHSCLTLFRLDLVTTVLR